LALWVDDAYDAFEQTTKRGAVPYQEPQTLPMSMAKYAPAVSNLYGETVHLVH
jgi:4-hydroxyphenylpyruvate dioxygenase